MNHKIYCIWFTWGCRLVLMYNQERCGEYAVPTMQMYVLYCVELQPATNHECIWPQLMDGDMMLPYTAPSQSQSVVCLYNVLYIGHHSLNAFTESPYVHTYNLNAFNWCGPYLFTLFIIGKMFQSSGNIIFTG